MSLLIISSHSKISLIRYPYLQSMHKDGLTILWRTNQGKSCYIQYKIKGEKTWDKTEGTLRVLSENVLENEVILKALAPNQSYEYQIFTDGQALLGQTTMQFNSWKDRSAKGFNFFAVGDIGEDVKDEGKPDKLGEALAPYALSQDFGLLLGDIIYPNGESKLYDTQLFQYFTGVFPYMTIWTVLGNHDWGLDPEENYKKEWKLPHNEHYYSFDHANAHFIALDSKKGDFFEYEKQKLWLIEDLEAAQQKGFDWLFVFLHHNGKSCTYKKDEEKVIALYPIFEKYHVDLVLNGHAHTYERLQPMNGQGELTQTYPYGQSDYENPQGFISITVGSGGKLRGVGTDPEVFEPDPENCRHPNLVAQSNHSWIFLNLSVEGKTLRAKAIRTLDQAVVDEFEVQKN
ncbi:MAG: metallophosphoesterase family protein [Microscillaceae bacterium]|nr:metallophosphoesterase family protein [Microscillaceae bacterium]